MTDPPNDSDDPIVAQTSWDALGPPGPRFCTQRLVDVGADRLEFRPTLGARLFSLSFLFLGLMGMTVFPVVMSSRGESGGFGALVIGLLFATVGGCMYYFGTTPVVFDRRTNHFWRGRRSLDLMPDRTDFEKIHALQIIFQLVRGGGRGGGTYYSYELNLVLSNGDRIHVVGHGNLRKLRADAARLARFLDVPVWDAGFAPPISVLPYCGGGSS